MIATLYQAGYDALWWALTPVINIHLKKRIAIGKEDSARLNERFGITNLPRPYGQLVWLHGASVGESVALLTVVEKLRAEANPPSVMVTTGTVTSAKVMKDRLPEGSFHQFMPLDRKLWVDRFLDHWRPDGVIWTESEIWPGVFAGIKTRHIPAVMINARLSAKTVRNWRWFKPWIKSLIEIFSFVTAQTKIDKKNWEDLGGSSAQMLGNIKFVVAEQPYDIDKLTILQAEIGNRPLWIFSSIHPGEELLAARVHQQLKAAHPDLLTFIIPRHPHRGDDFTAALRAKGLAVAQRSHDEKITAETQVYIADTIGEMGVFYRLGKTVVIGGSFVPHGGQNPIEPTKLKAAVLYGPHMFNFTAICTAFESAQAVRSVADEVALTHNLADLLAHPAKVAQLGEAAYDVAQMEANSLDVIWQQIGDWRAQALG